MATLPSPQAAQVSLPAQPRSHAQLPSSAGSPWSAQVVARECWHAGPTQPPSQAQLPSSAGSPWSVQVAVREYWQPDPTKPDSQLQRVSKLSQAPWPLQARGQ
jgi:hypothetical protein